jgi:hypothetical protein
LRAGAHGIRHHQIVVEGDCECGDACHNEQENRQAKGELKERLAFFAVGAKACPDMFSKGESSDTYSR